MSYDLPFIGVDLGTSNSVAAYIQDGRAFLVSDANGETVHPSVVSFLPDGQVLVGAAAARRLLSDARNTAYSTKRLIGRRVLDEEVERIRQRVGYQIVPDADGMAQIETEYGTHTATDVSAQILVYLRGCAERQLGRPIERAVITVPANFHDLQRKATKEAAHQAGFRLVRMLNEPTAAALAYGFGRGLTRRVAVFDFGGGTLDVTVLNLQGNIFEVLATAGDTALGGDDIDIRLAEAMAAACQRVHGVYLQHDAVAMSRLRRYAESLKCRLSEEDRVTIEVPDVAKSTSGESLSFAVTLDRATFRNRMADLFDRAIRVFEDSLRMANVSTPMLLDDTLLVGGTTRVVAVRDQLAAFLNKPPRSDVDPMQAVALGAAIHAATLGQGVTEEGDAVSGAGDDRPVLLDVTPRALGIGIVGGLCEVVIPRNTMVPTEETRVFVTSHDHQTKVRIPITQGESRKLSDNVSLGVLELDDLPSRSRGIIKVAVTFEINTDGILVVQAVNKETGKAECVRLSLGEVVGEVPFGGDLVPA